MAQANDTSGANILRLSSNVVINRTSKGGDLKFHDEKTGQYTRIDRDGYGVVSGNIDYILQSNNRIYKWSETIDLTLPGTVIVCTKTPGQDQDTLELHATGPDGRPSNFKSLPGEELIRVESATSNALVAPGINFSTKSLPGVVFTSSLQSSLDNLSLSSNDHNSEQAVVLDAYKRAFDGMIYRHDITFVEISSIIYIPINLGPLSITIAFNLVSLEGYVEASIIGISLGKARFDPDHGARIGVDVWLAKASVGVRIDSKAIYLEAHASTRLDGSADFGPEAIYHF